MEIPGFKKRSVLRFGLCLILAVTGFLVSPAISASALPRFVEGKAASQEYPGDGGTASPSASYIDGRNAAEPQTQVFSPAVSDDAERQNPNSNTSVFTPKNRALGLNPLANRVDPSEHPALKPITNPEPARIGQESNTGLRPNNLMKDTLYLVQSGKDSTGDIYALIPDGKGGFEKPAVSAPGKSRNSYGAAMGLTGGGEPIIFYIRQQELKKGSNQVTYTFRPWSAASGDTFQRQYSPYSYSVKGTGSCWGNPMAVAPNGTLWAYRDIGGDQAPTRFLAQFVPGGSQGPASTVFEAAVPGETLPRGGFCAASAVFDVLGNFYVKVGPNEGENSGEFYRFDVSQYPEKIIYKEIKPLKGKAGYDPSLTWYQNAWWTKDWRNGHPLVRIDPITGKTTEVEASIGGSSAELVSTGLAPGIFLDVNYTTDKPVAARGDTITYTVRAENTGSPHEASLKNDLSGIIGAADYDAASTSLRVTDAKGNPQSNSGQVTGLDENNMVTWTGVIPSDGKLVWEYQAKVKKATGELSSKVYTLDEQNGISNSLMSSCGSTYQKDPNADPEGKARCSVTVSLQSDDLQVKKSADTGKSVSDGIVSYTVTATNRGNKEYAGTVVDDLSEVLNKAVYNNDAQIKLVDNAGVVKPDHGSVNGPADSKLTWQGVPIAAGDTLTITFSVRLLPITRFT